MKTLQMKNNKIFTLISMRSSQVFDKLSKTCRTPQSSLPLNCSGIRGFTLIELLVVVLIIAILAAIALPKYSDAVRRAKMTEAFVNLKAAHDALKRYELANDDLNGANWRTIDISIGKDCTVETKSWSVPNGQLTCPASSRGHYFIHNSKNAVVFDEAGGGAGEAGDYLLGYTLSTGKRWCATNLAGGSVPFCRSFGGAKITSSAECPALSGHRDTCYEVP
ncbi:prepilin-type N-terminal cleavage/methylation domain-containing protein [Parelusimicrobium proximum]|uniref:prepilin-type N-terminal cleavage/methylation domain-containing protein n=1 Tax=Parelusimicrobium proximum TaxID=3228953 RepID=UPI003D17940A